MWQASRCDNSASDRFAGSQNHFMLTGQRGLVKDTLKRCLHDFAPRATVVDVESIGAAATAPPSARLLLFDANEAQSILPRDINLVREQHRGIRIVALGDADTQLTQQLILSSVDAFVPNSTRLSGFFDALNHVLAGGTYFPDEIDRCPVKGNTCVNTLSVALDSNRDDLGSVLTKRQRDVLALLAVGDSNKQIAQKLGIAEKTVKIHVASVCSQLGVDNRTRAAIIGLTMPALFNPERNLNQRFVGSVASRLEC